MFILCLSFLNIFSQDKKITDFNSKIIQSNYTLQVPINKLATDFGTNSALGTEFKNPYSTASSAIVTTTLSACNTSTEGQTSVSDDGSTVTIKSCTADGETLLSNTVTIE